MLCSYTKESDMKKITLLSLLALIVMTSLLGCNTAKGAGQDLENAGKSIQKTVDHNN